MGYDAWFRNAATGEGRWELDEIVYRAPDGELLEVAHDLEALRAERDGDAWKALWETRWRRPPAPFGSGVWGKKELVLPHIPDEHIVSLDEGGSSLLHAKRYGQECQRPSTTGRSGEPSSRPRATACSSRARWAKTSSATSS